MMHESARRRYHKNIAKAHGAGIDVHLDRYIDAWLRATEWDADQWGFDPDRWMEKERAELAARGGPDWPTEVTW